MLSAAGFRMLPADTPERQQQLASLVPLDVNYYVGKTGTLLDYMADPDYCKCCCTSAPSRIISNSKS